MGRRSVKQSISKDSSWNVDENSLDDANPISWNENNRFEHK